MMRTPATIATATLLLLAGCSMFPTSASLPEARCRAAGATAQLGQPLNDRTQELARMSAGAVRTQVLPYGAQIPARGADPQRLIIEVDQDRVIQRMRCG